MICTIRVQFEQYFDSNHIRVRLVLDASTSQTQVELTCKLNTIQLTRMPNCYGVGFTRALNLVMSWTCVWYHQGKFDLHFGIIWDGGLMQKRLHFKFCITRYRCTRVTFNTFVTVQVGSFDRGHLFVHRIKDFCDKWPEFNDEKAIFRFMPRIKISILFNFPYFTGFWFYCAVVKVLYYHVIWK